MDEGRLVHVIDDDDAVRESLGFLLETSGYRVTAYDSAQRFLDNLPPAEDACVITDIRMPGMTGLEMTAKLRGGGFAAPIIVITGHGDIPLAVEAMKAGAADFIEKPFADEAILRALDSAFAGRRDTTPAPSKEQAEIAERLAALSPRERQVLDGLVAGQANKVVALELGISPRTVEVYRANVMTKMRAGSLSELVKMAILAERIA
jgi:two-component system response regulator FixJ